MHEVVCIAPVSLVVDKKNPRIPFSDTNSRNTLRSLVELDPRKLLVLAEDIAENGLNPADVVLVMPVKGNPGLFTVLEGNRRISALKVLENPELVEDLLDGPQKAKLKEYCRQYNKTPVQQVNCVVFKSRDEANRWIALRHGGERGGAGTVGWGHEEAQRFLSGKGKLPLHVQALDFLQSQGKISPTDRADIKSTTSLQRLLGTAEVRDKLGVAISNGMLVFNAKPEQVAKALKYVIDDLQKTSVKRLTNNH